MAHRMEEIKPAHYVTKEECEKMIEYAINKHNRNASIISFCLGIVFLAQDVSQSQPAKVVSLRSWGSGPPGPLSPQAACSPLVLSWWLRRLFESIMGHSGSHGPSQGWVCTSALGVLAGRGFAHKSLAAAGRMEKKCCYIWGGESNLFSRMPACSLRVLRV